MTRSDEEIEQNPTFQAKCKELFGIMDPLKNKRKTRSSNQSKQSKKAKSPVQELGISEYLHTTGVIEPKEPTSEQGAIELVDTEDEPAVHEPRNVARAKQDDEESEYKEIIAEDEEEEISEPLVHERKKAARKSKTKSKSSKSARKAKHTAKKTPPKKLPPFDPARYSNTQFAEREEFHEPDPEKNPIGFLVKPGKKMLLFSTDDGIQFVLNEPLNSIAYEISKLGSVRKAETDTVKLSNGKTNLRSAVDSLAEAVDYWSQNHTNANGSTIFVHKRIQGKSREYKVLNKIFKGFNNSRRDIGNPELRQILFIYTQIRSPTCTNTAYKFHANQVLAVLIAISQYFLMNNSAIKKVVQLRGYHKIIYELLEGHCQNFGHFQIPPLPNTWHDLIQSDPTTITKSYKVIEGVRSGAQHEAREDEIAKLDAYAAQYRAIENAMFKPHRRIASKQGAIGVEPVPFRFNTWKHNADEEESCRFAMTRINDLPMHRYVDESDEEGDDESSSSEEDEF